MKNMKVSYIGIKNVLGIKSLECRPGKITSIDGPNASGKTSFLEAVKAALGGGHDGTLLRDGSDEGEIVLVFDNGMKLTKHIGREKSNVVLQGSDGGKIDKAASFLKNIVDIIGLNPIQLLTAPQKERVNILLDSVPLELPTKRIKKETEVVLDPYDSRHPIQIIDSLWKDFFDRRADKNRDIKSKTGMVDQMRESVPLVDSEEDFGALVEQLIDQKMAKDKEFNQQVQDEKVKFSNDLRELSEILRNKIATIRQNAEEEIERFGELHKKESDDLRHKNEKTMDQLSESQNPIMESLSNKIAVAKDRADNEIKVNLAKEYIKDGEKEIFILKAVSKSYTKKLKAIDAIKGEMLAGFPVKGLEVKDGDIYLDGIVFDNVNEARRIGFALELASIRKSDIPLVCVDGLEALDSNSFKLFCEMAEKTGMQFFVTRVNNDDRMSMNVLDEESGQ